jgi:PhoH-like ATPase
MPQNTSSDKKIFILDTNVLLHDPAAIFRFKEHEVFIPMRVLEELDQQKKGLSDVARNARQASRFMDELIQHADLAAIKTGIP